MGGEWGIRWVGGGGGAESRVAAQGTDPVSMIARIASIGREVRSRGTLPNPPAPVLPWRGHCGAAKDQNRFWARAQSGRLVRSLALKVQRVRVSHSRPTASPAAAQI